jgi:hypothetical protein
MTLLVNNKMALAFFGWLSLTSLASSSQQPNRRKANSVEILHLIEYE